MSRAAVCAVALAGCNQVFGLDPTVSLDANLGPDVIEAGPGRVRLTRTRVDVMGPGPGQPFSEVSAITNARLRAGLLTGELIVLEPDPLDAKAFVVPGIVLEQPSRLEVTLADGSPPIDIAWPDAAVNVDLMVPEIGHATGDEFGDEQWTITLSGGPSTVQRSAVLASGSWMSWQGEMHANPLDVNWARGLVHGDTRVRPAGARGDYTFALELADSDACPRLPIGFGAFPPPAFGPVMVGTAGWFTGTTELQASWRVLDEIATAGIALGELGTVNAVSQFTLGYAPMPQLVTRAWRIGPLMPAGMVGPGLLPLVECDGGALSSQPSFTPIRDLQEHYGETAYASVRFTRPVGPDPDEDSPTVDSGFEIVAPVAGDQMEPRAVVLGRLVALASAVEIASDGVFTPLDEDGREMPRTTSIGVRFATEAGHETNFWSVTLARIDASGGLVPVRMFLTLTPDATFDVSDTVRYPTGRYVFVIRGHLGWSRASTGDFATFELPYQIATTTSYMFTLP